MLSWLKPKPFRQPTQAEVIANSIAEKFRTSTLEDHYLDPQGISRMSVRWQGKIVKVEWFGGGRLLRLSIDHEPFLYNDTADIILRAAQARARQLLDERLAEIAGGQS